MKEVTCSKCGRLYPEDALVCPGCKQSNESYNTAASQNSFPPENKMKGKSTKALFLGFVFLIIGLLGMIISPGKYVIVLIVTGISFVIIGLVGGKRLFGGNLIFRK